MSAELFTVALLALAGSPAGAGPGPAPTDGAIAEAEWNAEGVYEWAIPELNTGGTLTIFRRSDGSWGSHGNLGGPDGSVLLCRETTVTRSSVVTHADGPMGKMIFTIKHADGAYTGMIDLEAGGFLIDATIKKIRE